MSIEVNQKVRADLTNKLAFKAKLLSYLSIFKTEASFFLAFTMLMNLVFVPLQLFAPIYAHQQISGGMNLYANLQISMGAGAILGGLSLTFISLGSIKSMRYLTLFLYLFSSGFYFLFSLNFNFVLSLISVFMMNCFMGAGNVLVLSLYQKSVKQTQLAFLISCVVFSSVAISPLALFLAGLFTAIFPLAWVIIAYAGASVLVSVFALFLLQFISKSELPSLTKEIIHHA